MASTTRKRKNGKQASPSHAACTATSSRTSAPRRSMSGLRSGTTVEPCRKSWYGKSRQEVGPCHERATGDHRTSVRTEVVSPRNRIVLARRRRIQRSWATPPGVHLLLIDVLPRPKGHCSRMPSRAPGVGPAQLPPPFAAAYASASPGRRRQGSLVACGAVRCGSASHCLPPCPERPSGHPGRSGGDVCTGGEAASSIESTLIGRRRPTGEWLALYPPHAKKLARLITRRRLKNLRVAYIHVLWLPFVHNLSNFTASWLMAPSRPRLPNGLSSAISVFFSTNNPKMTLRMPLIIG